MDAPQSLMRGSQTRTRDQSLAGETSVTGWSRATRPLAPPEAQLAWSTRTSRADTTRDTTATCPCGRREVRISTSTLPFRGARPRSNRPAAASHHVQASPRRGMPERARAYGTQDHGPAPSAAPGPDGAREVPQAARRSSAARAATARRMGRPLV
ncbi:MAG: hypothetical protein AVDCRST_MAG08-1694 [uncultured Acetobacteraceae bacterium]|uniref:Uncharacterized protein n=1 Tax=uncultured Acetobacteraceae bacterium TaxID=169975 RepID=A0A6J4I6C5_9PROT|nr:MAG: hypothetical protein AVDCRST_MAG08-1694 [uncultured Acetobacteraceae bacterium]